MKIHIMDLKLLCKKAINLSKCSKKYFCSYLLGELLQSKQKVKLDAF